MMHFSGFEIRMFVAVLLGAVISTSAHDQAVKGAIVGAVTDSSGGAVPNAQVVMTETRTGLVRKAQANQNGFYSVPDLLPGAYSLSFEYAGFRRLVRDNVEVLVNTTVRVDAELQPGTVNESIEVKATLPDLQTDRADTGRKIETQQISDMPLAFNRNFQSLLNLAPGVNRVVRIHSEFYNPQDALSARVNGQAAGEQLSNRGSRRQFSQQPPSGANSSCRGACHRRYHDQQLRSGARPRGRRRDQYQSALGNEQPARQP